MKPILAIAVFVILVLYLDNCEARVRVRSSRSRFRSRSGSGGSSGGSRTKPRIFKGYKPGTKVTRNTPIPVLLPRTPVISIQTRVADPKLVRRVHDGPSYQKHNLKDAPVYREKFYMYGCEVTIPSDRALRVNFTKQNVQFVQGKECLSTSLNDSRSGGQKVRTTFLRREVDNPSKLRLVEVINGRNKTNVRFVSTSFIPSYYIQVSTIVEYNYTTAVRMLDHNSTAENATIANCTQVHSVVNGTVVRLYATNPDADAKAGIATSSILTVLSSSVLLLLLHS